MGLSIVSLVFGLSSFKCLFSCRIVGTIASFVTEKSSATSVLPLAARPPMASVSSRILSIFSAMPVAWRMCAIAQWTLSKCGEGRGTRPSWVLIMMVRLAGRKFFFDADFRLGHNRSRMKFRQRYRSLTVSAIRFGSGPSCCERLSSSSTKSRRNPGPPAQHLAMAAAIVSA